MRPVLRLHYPLRGATILVLLAVLFTSVGGRAVAAAGSGPLTNLAHLNFLGDTVTPPPQDGHTTYRSAGEPVLHALWTYAEPAGDGTYRRVGGGTYDSATNTWGQGAFNTDDMARAAVVYTRHWRQFDDASSQARAYEFLRMVAYMQTLAPDGRRGNFVLWMQPDGTLNPSATPKELPDPSDSGPSYWLARAIWALGEGYAAFRGVDPAFAAFLQSRIALARDALDRQVLVNYGQYRLLDGVNVPAWLVVDGADASSEAVYGLAAYVQAAPADGRAHADLAELADGVARMHALSDATRWPFGAIFPWAQSRSVWHAWADQMAGALATAGTVLGDQRLVQTAVDEVGLFTPHLLAQGGADQGWLPAPADRAQIAYGADATLQNVLRTADATGRQGFRQLAGIAGAWYFGNNRSQVAMYDPATGRTFDGLEADGRINRNSGAESTIHGLLSMLALDARPDVRALATMRQRREQAPITWQLYEAEAGTLAGSARVVTPSSAWTGESLWSGGKYVELGPGGRTTLDVRLPTAGRYRLLPVFDHQPIALYAAGTRHMLMQVPFGIVWHGGAGAPGISPTSGYLDIANTGSDRIFPAGAATLLSAYVGDGTPARLDAMLVEPEIEQLILTGPAGAQGLLRSWAGVARVQHVSLGSGVVTAYVYDSQGRLAATVSGAADGLDVPLQPYGFTYLMTR